MRPEPAGQFFLYALPSSFLCVSLSVPPHHSEVTKSPTPLPAKAGRNFGKASFPGATSRRELGRRVRRYEYAASHICTNSPSRAILGQSVILTTGMSRCLIVYIECILFLDDYLYFDPSKFIFFSPFAFLLRPFLSFVFELSLFIQKHLP